MRIHCRKCRSVPRDQRCLAENSGLHYDAQSELLLPSSYSHSKHFIPFLSLSSSIVAGQQDGKSLTEVQTEVLTYLAKSSLFNDAEAGGLLAKYMVAQQKGI